MEQLELRKWLRAYIETDPKNVHYLEDKKKWTAHFTLGYDIFELGDTRNMAIQRLINTIVGNKSYTDCFIEMLRNR